jgi:hypothetical protein
VKVGGNENESVRVGGCERGGVSNPIEVERFSCRNEVRASLLVVVFRLVFYMIGRTIALEVGGEGRRVAGR